VGISQLVIGPWPRIAWLIVGLISMGIGMGAEKCDWGMTIGIQQGQLSINAVF
jgi:hypothetical protein